MTLTGGDVVNAAIGIIGVINAIIIVFLVRMLSTMDGLDKTDGELAVDIAKLQANQVGQDMNLIGLRRDVDRHHGDDQKAFGDARHDTGTALANLRQDHEKDLDQVWSAIENLRGRKP